MYNVSNGMLKVGQVVQYKACVLSLKTVEIFRIRGRGGEQAGDFRFGLISQATDVPFVYVFISLDSSFH